MYFYVAPPSTCKDTTVLIPKTKEEALQKIKHNSVLVPNKRNFLPNAKTWIKNRCFVNIEILANRSVSLKSEIAHKKNMVTVTLIPHIINDKIEKQDIKIDLAYCGMHNPLSPSDINALCDALETSLTNLGRLENARQNSLFMEWLSYTLTSPNFKDIFTRTHDNLHAEQIPRLKEEKKLEVFNTVLKDIPFGTFVVTTTPGKISTLKLYKNHVDLSPNHRVYLLNKNSDLSGFQKNFSAHDYIALLKEIEKGPDQSPILLPQGSLEGHRLIVEKDILEKKKIIKTYADKIYTDTIFVLDPNAYKHQSYSFTSPTLGADYTLKKWNDSLPDTPNYDLFFVEQILLCTSKAKSVLQTLSIGNTSFFPLAGQSDIFVVTITPEKECPSNVSLFFYKDSDGYYVLKEPLYVTQTNIKTILTTFVFSNKVLEGEDIWNINKVDIGNHAFGDSDIIAFSKKGLETLKKHKLKLKPKVYKCKVMA
jgi:hypothetical protein